MMIMTILTNAYNNNNKMKIIAITIIVIILLLVIIILNATTAIAGNNDNVNKNRVIWWQKCFLRLCLKVFKLLAFFNVSRIWFQNEGPRKDKAFWPVFVFWEFVYFLRNYSLNQVNIQAQIRKLHSSSTDNCHWKI